MAESGTCPSGTWVFTLDAQRARRGAAQNIYGITSTRENYTQFSSASGRGSRAGHLLVEDTSCAVFPPFSAATAGAALLWSSIESLANCVLVLLTIFYRLRLRLHSSQFTSNVYRSPLASNKPRLKIDVSLVT